jgi:hypothetical protein
MQHTPWVFVYSVIFFYFGIGGLVKVVDDHANSHSSNMVPEQPYVFHANATPWSSSKARR